MSTPVAAITPTPVKILPRQHREQIAEGEETHKKIYPTSVEPDNSAPQTAEQSPPAADGQPATPAPAPAPPAAAPEDEESYRQRYLTLQGKYQAEVPALQNRVDGLQHLLANLPVSRQTITPVEGTTPEDDERIRTIREEFGDEFVDAITRHAMASMRPVINELQNAVADHNRSLQTAQISAAQDAQTEMYNYLTTYVGPDWQQINRHPAWHYWLAQIDVFAGVPRQLLIENAYAANSGPRVAAFFLTFLREQTATGAAPSAQNQSPGAPTSAPRQSLETWVAPGRTVSAPVQPVSAPNGRMWTSAQIQAFYSDKRRGLYKSRQAEADALELDIIAAGREGRVQG